MRRALLSIAALGLLAAPAPAVAKVPKGPKGDAFYNVTKKIPKKHGTAIWTRKAPSGARFSTAGTSRLIVYSSRNVRGKAAAVSGTVWTPKGKAPKGGWPVVSWTQGTTGIGDRCPASKNDGSGPAEDVVSYYIPQLKRFLSAGYAVVRTDYEGLGTPGVH